MDYQLSGGNDPLTKAVVESENVEELLAMFSDGGPSDARSLAAAVEASFRRDLASMGKGLFGDHAGEKQGVASVHVFHGFDGAMQAAFPGWPDDLTAANQFASTVFFSGGKIFALSGGRQEVTAAFKRFVRVLWPGKKAADISAEKQIALLKIIAKGVKYCSADYVEKKYKVDLGPPMTRRGEVFDSKALFDRKIGSRYLSGSMSVASDETRCRSIWVMTWSNATNDPVFYSHVGKLGRFHHSSFKAGEAIMAGGEWVVDQGKLDMVNACSGHYRPEAWRFRVACNYLKNKGVIDNGTRLEVWQAGNRELVPCLAFLGDFDRRLAAGYQLFPG